MQKGYLFILLFFLLPSTVIWAQLADCYDASNWTTNTDNTNGSVVDDGTTIVITGDSDGTGTNLDVLDCAAADGNVTYCITVHSSGEITFDWEGPSGFNFNPFVEKFGYCLNGVATELTSADPPPFGTSSGSATITVEAGDELCFIAGSKFSDALNSFPYTISNLVLPACPAPDCYDGVEWTTNTENTNGSVVDDGNTIVITGDSDGTGTNLDMLDCAAADGNVTYCITVPSSGEITFDWEGPSGFNFNPFVEKFGYCLNGVATELTSADPPPFGTSSGSATITVEAGDELCFIAGSKFSDALNSFPYTISNLVLPACPGALTTMIAAEQDVLDCFGDIDGSILVTPSGGSGDYTYEWDNATATGSNPIGLSAGTYCVTVTDTDGNTATACATIEQPAELIGTATLDADVSCNGGSDGQATASQSGGTMGYSYAWDNLETTATAISLSSGVHIVTIMDANGCETTAMLTVNEPDALSLMLSSTAETDMNSDGTATATVGGGTTDYSYAWSTSPVQNTATATDLVMGTYTVTVTDANGCEIVDEIMVDRITAWNDFSEISSLNVFPNPSSGKVFLEMELDYNLDITIQLINSIGQEVSAVSLGNTNSVQHTFDLEKLPKGMYWLNITSQERRIARKIILE